MCSNSQQLNQHLYKSWFKEYMGVELLECEQGFMTYRIENEYCYICDMYVNPEARGSKLSAKMADMVTIKAIEEGCKFLIGFVNFPSPYAEKSLEVQFKYGFKIDKILPNKIVLKKGI